LNRKKTFEAEIKQLRPMIHWIREQLFALGLDETNVRKTELASEEALVNVMDHGYKGKSGRIEIEILSSSSQIEIVIRDWGVAFNPLEQEVGFDPLATLEEREIGGLGILFMRQYVDEIQYLRKGDANVLTLIKYKAA
jgi:anti-sigma regulatory factor (Ser/Thr protein kinase)